MKIEKLILIFIIFSTLFSGRVVFAQSDVYIQNVLSNMGKHDIHSITNSVKWLNDHSSTLNRSYALVLLKDGAKKNPNHVPLLYQWTRYEIMNGFDGRTATISSKSCKTCITTYKESYKTRAIKW